MAQPLHMPARPRVLPVLGVQERLMRHVGLAMSPTPADFAIRRFHPRIRGLESFGGRKVLEIGGTDETSLRRFFSRIGSDYSCVRLEKGSGWRGLVVGDFMDLRGEFDLVISLGVFELGALDINLESSRPLKNDYSLSDRAVKLHSLVRAGGFAVVGTISAPCIFGDGTLLSAGFSILHREGPFYSFMFPQNKDVYARDDRSELLIILKR